MKNFVGLLVPRRGILKAVGPGVKPQWVRTKPAKLFWESKKNAPVPKPLGRERKTRFVVPPKFKAPRASFGLLWYGEGAVGVSAPAPPLSFIQAEQGALSAAPLSEDRCLHYCCGIFTVNSRTDCIRFSGKCQAMGRVEGFTMQRQSRSPQARPSTSISAVAMLLAKGMLFWSQRREM